MLVDRRSLNLWLAGTLVSCASRQHTPAAPLASPVVSGSTPVPPPAPPPSFPERLGPSRASTSFPWYADLGDGTYQNPVIFGDYSDPDVIRVGREYYLVASSFNCTPALPILSSRDLVNWSHAGYALDRLPDARYDEVVHGGGIWAPALREHGGVFYLFAPTPDEGIYVLTAKSPEGPWSAPRLLLAGRGLIDPCPFWDDDGKAYLVHAYARSRAGFADRLRVRPMAPDASAVLGEGEVVYHDPEHHPTLEGPKFYKRNGSYYLLAPAGGVKNGWQLALRSRSVFGPYEARTVLEQGQTAINGPHQGALVDTPQGEWWFVHFQEAGVYGRLVHLNPVTWTDDWPLMGIAGEGGKREPVVRYRKPSGAVQAPTVLQASDEFDGGELAPCWQWHANHKSDWYSLSARPKYLRLYAQAVANFDFSKAPNLLLQKLPARAFVAETQVEVAAVGGKSKSKSRFGLIVMGEHHAAVTLEPAVRGLVARLVIDNQVVESAELARGPIRIGVAFADGGDCRFFFQAPGELERSFAALFRAVPGRWIGAKVGLFALAGEPATEPGHADFAYFRFDALS